jgi:Ribbon-helix-helix protein, copG family
MCITVHQLSSGEVMPNKKREEALIRVTVGLDQSDHDRLSLIARDADVSLAWILRKAAADFLARHPQTESTAQIIFGKNVRDE